MLSYWQKASFTHKTDINIIGAGLTGLITAIYLREAFPNKSVRVIERSAFPDGASARNAGFACYGSVSELLDDMAAEGEDKAFGKLAARYDGLKLLLELTADGDIGLGKNGGYEIFGPDDEDSLKECKAAMEAINARLDGPEFKLLPNTMIPGGLPELIHTPQEASINSGMLLKTLCQKAVHLGVDLCFNEEVYSLERNGHWTLETSLGERHSEIAILCTNAFTSKLVSGLDIKAARGQVLLTEPIEKLNIKGNFHYQKGYFYFRNLGNRILLGGGRHLDRENEFTDSTEISTLIQRELEYLLRELIIPGQNPEIDQRWAGTMAFGNGNNKNPIVEEHKEGLFLAARLGGMGVAMAAPVAKRLLALLD